VTGLEYATGVTATVIGKPETTFFHEALKLVQVAPANTVMVGDVSDCNHVYGQFMNLLFLDQLLN